MLHLRRLFLAADELEVNTRHFSPIYFINWQMDNYDLHLLVIADSISQHGDLLERNVGSEIRNVLHDNEAELPLNAKS